MSNLAAWKKLKFESVFLLDLRLPDLFFMNLQMSKFAFLNTTTIIFCLIYSLNIPHSNQNPSLFLHWSLSINDQSLLYISAAGKKIILTFMKYYLRKYLWHFFSCHFAIVTGDGLLPGHDEKYKVHNLFIVSKLSS